jgi:hypothetical protein
MAKRVLEYDDRCSAGNVRRRDVPLRVACAFLTLFAVQTCIRIEVANSLAGHILPRYDVGKWRESFAQSQWSWRIRESARQQDPSLQTRPLTSEESQRMTRETTVNRRDGELRDLVGGLGTTQYLVVPAAIILSLCLLVQDRPPKFRIAGGVCGGLATVCGYFMLYREYFSSLEH